uniref:Amine oxidase n=1 Tax=Oryza meridionalis TaxID=40149 RepID=A0A0E0E1Q9_9ORYZ
MYPPLVLVLAIFFTVATTIAAMSSPLPHPLDLLSPTELTAVRSAVLASSLVASRPISFHYVGLDEPKKPDVLSHTNAAAAAAAILPRRAFVIARAGGLSHEFYVDVTNTSAPRVVSHGIHDGPGFPMFTTEEQVAARQLSREYPPFRESMRRCGLALTDVGCGVFSMGWFGKNEARRLAKVQCFVVAGGTANYYARPLEGVTLLVDVKKLVIVGYRDRAAYSVPKDEGTDYRAGKAGPPFNGAVPAPGVVVQPEGKGFHIDGHIVRWANWEFHMGFDMRAGTVISMASVHDADADLWRRVLYRGFVSEIFVPYMDPEEESYFHTFMDASEYGLGVSAVPLQPEADCPANAAYMDGYYVDADGKPVKSENIISSITEVRPDVTLVVRMVVTVGNYDYTLDWEFKTVGLAYPHIFCHLHTLCQSNVNAFNYCCCKGYCSTIIDHVEYMNIA